MKRITVNRGKSTINFKTENGDIYTDTLSVFDEKGDKLYFTNYANSDPTTGYKGGIIVSGIYYGIVGEHKGKYDSIKLFSVASNERLKEIESLVEKANTPKKKNAVWTKLTTLERTFKSKVPNANHGNKEIIQLVAIHKGGYNWDWSNGCITILKTNYERFIKCFEAGEIMIVEIV
jgi:hypothetical protein